MTQTNLNQTKTKRAYRSLAASLFFALLSFSSFANVTITGGTSAGVLAGSPYTTLAAAISALNSGGPLTAPVVLDVSAGHTETLTAPIILTLSGTATNTIKIQKNGAGANPVLTSYAGTSAGTAGLGTIDGMFILSGSDYVTIDGIDLQEAAGNVTATTQMEVGFGLFKANLNDGCQNDTIKNCSTTFARLSTANGASWTGSTAIVTANATWAAVSTLLVPTLISGTNSNNGFKLNTLTGGSAGIQSIGYLLDLTNALCDQNNSYINNTITDFGNASTSSVHGISFSGAAGFTCSNNTIVSSSTNKHAGTINGVFDSNAGVGGNGTIDNNIITIHGGGTTTNIQGIRVQAGTSTALINITNNQVINSTYTTCTSGVFFGILTTGSAGTYSIISNTVSGNSIVGAATFSGQVYMISVTTGAPTNVKVNWNIINNNSVLNGAITTATGAVRIIDVQVGTNVLIRDNSINGFTRQNGVSTSTVGNYSAIICTGGGTQNYIKHNTVNNINYNGSGTGSTMVGIGSGTSSGLVVDSNTVTNITNNKSTGTSTIYGIFNGSSSTNENYNSNTITGITSNGATIMYGMNVTGSTGTRTVSRNLITNVGSSGTTIAGLSLTGSTPTVFGNKIYNIFSTSIGAPTVSGIIVTNVSSTGITIHNNYIGDLRAASATSSAATTPSVRGINFTLTTASSTLNVYYNTIYLDGTSTGTLFSTACLYHTFNTTNTTASLNLQNNILVNNCIPVGAGKSVALMRSAATNLNNFSTSSNTNLLYAGSPSISNLIYYDGTNLGQTIFDYQTLVAPREIGARTENPPFVSTTGSNVNYLHLNTGIATYAESNAVAIPGFNNDYDNDIRQGSIGYAGAGTAPDIGADEGEFTTLAGCSGTPPVATAALTNPASVCGPVTKTITLTGFTPLPGYVYQWQESSTGIPGSFTNVSAGSGATTGSYTTAALNASTYFLCIVTCSNGGAFTPSTAVQVVYNTAPTLVTNPTTGTAACSGSRLTLSASGAVSYVWSVNPGVAGYSTEATLITPNNLDSVTSVPTSTLSSNTASTPTTVATPTWTYTVTGTGSNGCTSNAAIVINLTTATEVPLQLTYTNAPSSVCAPGTPVSITVNNSGIAGAGSWTYNWYDASGNTLLQSNTNTLSSDTYTPPTPVSNGNYAYRVKVTNSVCPSSYAIAQPSYFIGYASNNSVSNANCGDNGIIKVYPEGQDNYTTWYSNDFTIGLVSAGVSDDSYVGNAGTHTMFTGGKCVLVPMATSQGGNFVVRNPTAINTNNLQVDFLTTTTPLGYGASILGGGGYAWSYGPDVYSAGVVTPGTTGFNAENGTGSKLKIAFDGTANGAINKNGAYLMFNCSTQDQGPLSSGVIAYTPGNFWHRLNNAPVSITITEDGYLTMKMNNIVVFNHIALPAAYLTADKSNWIHSFTSRTGAADMFNAIDNLSIRYNSFEYSINSTNGTNGTWQTSNTFNGLATGSYPVWVRNPSNTACFANTGTAIIGTSPSPSSATTVAVSGYQTTVCAGNSTTLTTDISVPGATFLWESSNSLGGPYTPAGGINDTSFYSTEPLINSTYFRCTFTCPSSSAVTSTPILVTVNIGSIASTNSPQVINCLGDNANLSVTPGANTSPVWYTSASGGSPVNIGNTFSVTPTSLPTTYYVEPVTTLFTDHFNDGGQKVISNGAGTTGSGTGIATRFITTASIRIDSIKVFPTTTGTLTVALQNSGSATNISTFTKTITSTGAFINVPVNFVVPGSGNYQLTTTGVSCTYYSSYTATYSASYMTMGGVMNINGGATSATGASSTSVYGTSFNWSITTSCAAGFGNRVPVTVNLNPSFLVSVTPSSSSVCANGTIQQLAASSLNAYSSYVWTPITFLYTDAAATVPYLTGTNAATVYAKPSGAGSISYTVTATGSGCTNTASTILSATAAPLVSVSATPQVIPSGGNSQLTAVVTNNTVSSYSFAASSGSFVPLAGPTSTSLTATSDESISNAFNIGFNFTYAGVLYTTVQATPNGTLLFGSGKVNSSTNNLATTVATQRPGLAPLWDNLQCSSGVNYQVSGTSGNQVLTVEWLNMEWSNLSSSNVISFQVKLYENGNVVQFVYRDEGATVNAGSASIGLMGVASSDFLSLENTSSSPSISISTSNNTIGTKPATGQTYTFTPLTYSFDWSANSTFLNATNIYNPIAQNVTSPQTYTVNVQGLSGCASSKSVSISTGTPACPASITVNNSACVSATSLSWTAVPQFTSGYYVYVGTDGGGITIPTNVLFQQDVLAATTVNLPILQPNTLYYYYISPYNSNGENLGCTIGSFTSGQSILQTVTQASNSYTETMDNGVAVPALPCGMTSSDENFPQDGFTWYTSTIAPHSGTRHLRIDKNTNNTTAKDDWFYSAPMNLTAGKLYRIYFWNRVGTAGSESFEVFLSNSADAATMLTTSAVFNGTSNLLTYKLDSTADILPLVDGIYYYGFHANGAANGRSLYIDDIQIKQIPVAALDPASCTTLGSLYDQILVQPVFGAQDYKFKVENLASSFSYEYTRNLAIPDFRLKWAPGVVYDLTYDVFVSYKKNNVWSPYGPPCPVTMGPFPVTQLHGASCGTTLTDQYTPIFIDSVGGANDYEFRIVQNTLAYDHTWMRGAPVLDYRLYWAYQSAPTLVEHLQFGFTYDIQVRALVGRTGPAQGNLPGVLGTFGPVCTVTLAGQPQTQLVAAAGPQQSCGKTLTNITDPIYCIPVSGASNYRYHVVNTALGYDVTAQRNSSLNDYRLNWLPTVSGVGLRYSTTYDITVSDYVGGLWSTEGSICQVTTPAQPLTQLQPTYCAYTLPTFSTPIYCNVVPAATNYRYRITGPLGYSKIIDRNSPGNDFRFTWTLVCCGGQNVLPNTPYTVEVASYAGGVWSAYGSPCTVTTSATVPRYNPFLAEEGLSEETPSDMSISVYPNPAAVSEEYAIELNGIQSANETVSLDIYNMLGEKVYHSDITTKNESRLIIKPENILSTGVYMIEAKVNGNIIREKLMVN